MLEPVPEASVLEPVPIEPVLEPLPEEPLPLIESLPDEPLGELVLEPGEVELDELEPIPEVLDPEPGLLVVELLERLPKPERSSPQAASDMQRAAATAVANTVLRMIESLFSKKKRRHADSLHRAPSLGVPPPAQP